MFLTIIATLSLYQAQATTTPAPAPVVVELFTSQSCSSCPPAEANFREIARRDDVIALEWHVDYWDELRVGSAGKWKDPYSKPAHTERQRVYNAALRGRNNVYTPQAIINGAAEVVGSRRKQLDGLIAAADRLPARIDATKVDGDIMFKLSGVSAEALLVTFQRSATTRVGGGENNGRDLSESHVVTAHRKLGDVKAGETEFMASAPAAGFGCALLLQDKSSRKILGAAYCPS